MGKRYVEAYIGVLVVLGMALAATHAHWYGIDWDPRLALGAVVCGALILLGDVFPIRTFGRTTFGVWDVGLVVAIAALGPTWAAVAALPSAFYVGGRNRLRTTYEVGLVPWYRHHGYEECSVRQLTYPGAPTFLDVIMTKRARVGQIETTPGRLRIVHTEPKRGGASASDLPRSIVYGNVASLR